MCIKLCDQISRRNRNRIIKYFSLFIRGLYGFKSLKNGGKKSCDTLPLKNKQRNTNLKFDFEKVLFWTPEKVHFWFFKKTPQNNFFCVFWLWFSFKNNRHTNALLVGIFKNTQKKVLTVKNAILASLWRLITFFLCVFKNTDQNNSCVPIVLKAKSEKKIYEKMVGHPKKGIFEFERKTVKKIFFSLSFKNNSGQMLIWSGFLKTQNFFFY